MDLTQLSQCHPEWYARQEEWMRMRAAYMGGDAFKRGYLWQYEREDPEDWQARLQRASYENLLKDIIDRRESLVYGRLIRRDVKPANEKVWDALKEDADGKGTGWAQHIRALFRMMQYTGHLPVFIDQKKGKAETELERQEKRLYPRLVPIHPLAFRNWAKDEAGLLWGVSRHVRNESKEPGRPVERVTEYYVYTREKTQLWREVKEGDEVKVVLIDEAVHDLGVVPVLFLRDVEPEEGMLGLASLLDPCDLSIKLYNQSSWYDQLLYKTNYSTLAANPFNGSSEEPEVIVGAGDVFWVPEGGMPPQWISPDVGPANVFEAKIKDMRRRIYEQAQLDAGQGEDVARDLSGEAYDRRHRPTEDMAKRLGATMEAFETKALEFIFHNWEGDENATVKIDYPKRYSVRATADAVAELTAIEQVQSLPPAIRARVAAGIVFTDGFAELSDEEQEELEKEIMSFDPEAAEVAKTKALEEAKVEPQLKVKEAEGKTRIEEAKINAEAQKTQKKPGLFGG